MKKVPSGNRTAAVVAKTPLSAFSRSGVEAKNATGVDTGNLLGRIKKKDFEMPDAFNVNV